MAGLSLAGSDYVRGGRRWGSQISEELATNKHNDGREDRERQWRSKDAIVRLHLRGLDLLVDAHDPEGSENLDLCPSCCFRWRSCGRCRACRAATVWTEVQGSAWLLPRHRQHSSDLLGGRSQEVAKGPGSGTGGPVREAAQGVQRGGKATWGGAQGERAPGARCR